MKKILSLLLLLALSSQAFATANIIGQWRFEDNLNDSSGNGYTAVATGGSVVYSAVPGCESTKAYTGGSATTVKAPAGALTAISSKTNWDIFTYIYVTDLGPGSQVFEMVTSGNLGTVAIIVDGNGALLGFTAEGNVIITNNGDITANTCRLVRAQFRSAGSTFKIFVGASEKGSYNVIDTDTATVSSVSMGSDGAGAVPVAGYLDDFNISQEIAGTPTITPTRTTSPTPSITPSPSATPTKTITPSITKTRTITVTSTATPSSTATPTSTRTITPSVTKTATRTASPTPSVVVPTATPTPRLSLSPGFETLWRHGDMPNGVFVTNTVKVGVASMVSGTGDVGIIWTTTPIVQGSWTAGVDLPRIYCFSPNVGTGWLRVRELVRWNVTAPADIATNGRYLAVSSTTCFGPTTANYASVVGNGGANISGTVSVGPVSRTAN